MIRLVLAILLASSLAGSAERATIADAAFLAGTWEAEALGGWCEEIWSAPRDGVMMGVFRMMTAGETKFYEIMQLVEDGDALALRLKHFDARLHGWEGKDEVVEFPFGRSSPGLLEFEGIVLRGIDENHVKVTVTIRQADGSSENVDFAYRRSGT